MDDNKDPNEEHERQATVPDMPKVSEDEAWGLKLNPLRDDPLPATNLGSGGSAK